LVVVGTRADGSPITFLHPAVQSACMFLGEALCLGPYFYLRRRRRLARAASGRPPAVVEPSQPGHTLKRALAFALPALCDAVATTLLNVGLYFTYASTFQSARRGLSAAAELAELGGAAPLPARTHAAAFVLAPSRWRRVAAISLSAAGGAAAANPIRTISQCCGARWCSSPASSPCCCCAAGCTRTIGWG
jgi:hypothetical protein